MISTPLPPLHNPSGHQLQPFWQVSGKYDRSVVFLVWPSPPPAPAKPDGAEAAGGEEVSHG